MVKDHRAKKKKLVAKTVIYGLAATALYAALFLNTSTVAAYFTRGGWYAALPIITAFVFSFVHGAFTGYFWSAVGVEATKKVVQPQPTAPAPALRKRPRPRVWARLYRT